MKGISKLACPYRELVVGENQQEGILNPPWSWF